MILTNLRALKSAEHKPHDKNSHGSKRLPIWISDSNNSAGQTKIAKYV